MVELLCGACKGRVAIGVVVFGMYVFIKRKLDKAPKGLVGAVI